MEEWKFMPFENKSIIGFSQSDIRKMLLEETPISRTLKMLKKEEIRNDVYIYSTILYPPKSKPQTQ